MKNINVYDDGKIGRGKKAVIVRAKSKRILIKFYDNFDEKYKTLWFNKVRRYGCGVYENKETNTWFYRYRETEHFKREMKECLTSSCYDKLFTK